MSNPFLPKNVLYVINDEPRCKWILKHPQNLPGAVLHKLLD